MIIVVTHQKIKVMYDDFVHQWHFIEFLFSLLRSLLQSFVLTVFSSCQNMIWNDTPNSL